VLLRPPRAAGSAGATCSASTAELQLKRTYIAHRAVGIRSRLTALIGLHSSVALDFRNLVDGDAARQQCVCFGRSAVVLKRPLSALLALRDAA